MKSATLKKNKTFSQLVKYLYRNYKSIKIRIDENYNNSHCFHCGSSPDGNDILIGIEDLKSTKQAISILCHEIGHYLDYKSGLWAKEYATLQHFIPSWSLQHSPKENPAVMTIEVQAWITGLKIVKAAIGEDKRIVKAFIDSATWALGTYWIYNIQEVDALRYPE